MYILSFRLATSEDRLNTNDEVMMNRTSILILESILLKIIIRFDSKNTK